MKELHYEQALRLAAAAKKAPYTYTAEDKARAQTVLSRLERMRQTRSWLARKANISNSTLSQVLTGKYFSPVGEFLDRMLAVLELESERISDGTPGYVEGSVHKLCMVVCDRTRKDANFGVLAGHVGVGKTRALQEYARRRPLTLLVESNPGMSARSLLDELLEQLHGGVVGNQDQKFNVALKALVGTNYLLICDEAEHLQPQALHYLRRLRDKARIGVVLSGTTKLHQLLKPEQGQFDQIRSRVSMWPATITAITRDDADDMARQALAELRNADGTAVDATDEVLDTLWAYGMGSARVLMEGLIPAIRDYGQGRACVDVALIDKIARSVLLMKRSKA